MNYEKLIFDCFYFHNYYKNSKEYFISEYKKVNSEIPLNIFFENCQSIISLIKKDIDRRYYKRKTELSQIKDIILQKKDSISEDDFKYQWDIYESNLDFRKEDYYFHSGRFTNNRYNLNISLDSAKSIENSLNNAYLLIQQEQFDDSFEINTASHVRTYINQSISRLVKNPKIILNVELFTQRINMLSDFIDNQFLSSELNIPTWKKYFILIKQDVKGHEIEIDDNSTEQSIEVQKINFICYSTKILLDDIESKMELQYLNILESDSTESKSVSDKSFISSKTIEEIKKIFDTLITNKFIENTDYNNFYAVFNNQYIDQNKKVNWISTKKLLAHFITKLIDEKYIDNTNFWVIASQSFLFNGKLLKPSDLSKTSEKNKTLGLPKNYDVINSLFKR